MSDLFWLSDEQMTRLEPFFPKSHGEPRVDDRRVLSGIDFHQPRRLKVARGTQGIRPAQDALQSLETVERQRHLRRDADWFGR